jgi:gentisate 1,2-dioxygenase
MNSNNRSAAPDRDLAGVIEELEILNEEAARKNLWIRTKWNLSNQNAWHLGKAGPPRRNEHNLALEHAQPVAHVWKWADIERYLMTLIDLCPLELTKRQSVLLTNPAFGQNGVKISSTIRIAISIYKPGDIAEAHSHTPNASRTIISESGGYTMVEGEKMQARRGDLIFTPNGTWHSHGNEDSEPVIWADTLDWPLLDYLGCVEARGDAKNAPEHGNPPDDFSQLFYGRGGIKPLFEAHPRGIGRDVTRKFHYEATDIIGALRDLSRYEGDPYEGIHIELVNPANGRVVFPTLSYRAQLLKEGQTTEAYRHRAAQVYFVYEGAGHTDVDGKRLEWGRNDFFVVPGYSWRRHTVTGGGSAILYSVTDVPLMEAIGLYRAQGKLPSGKIVELA